MMTRERCAHRNTPCGRGRAGYVTESLCRLPTETHHAMKCRQSEGLPNTQRENRGRAITDMWLHRWKGSQSKVVVKAAPNSRVANVAPRRISISSWRNRDPPRGHICHSRVRGSLHHNLRLAALPAVQPHICDCPATVLPLGVR